MGEESCEGGGRPCAPLGGFYRRRRQTAAAVRCSLVPEWSGDKLEPLWSVSGSSASGWAQGQLGTSLPSCAQHPASPEGCRSWACL